MNLYEWNVRHYKNYTVEKGANKKLPYQAVNKKCAFFPLSKTTVLPTEIHCKKKFHKQILSCSSYCHQQTQSTQQQPEIKGKNSEQII